MTKFTTSALIPTNGIHVTETYYPAGWQVARHDAEGLASDLRWFPTRAAAEAHANKLTVQS